MITINKMVVCGFEFVKVGEFYISDKPYGVTFNGKADHINVVLNFVDDSFRKADESAYIITVNNELRYVGEYSYSLSDRWLRKGNYVWHNQDEEIEKVLRQGDSVELWVTIDPYYRMDDSNEVNISKSIEQEILRRNGKLLVWNKRGQLQKWAKWRQDNCERVISIIEKISANKPPS